MVRGQSGVHDDDAGWPVMGDLNSLRQSGFRESPVVAAASLSQPFCLGGRWAWARCSGHPCTGMCP